MSVTLFLNQPQANVGIQTYTITMSADGNYNAKFQALVPQALAVGTSSGSGAGLGAGSGGGGEGFTGGDLGTGHGGVGQGFGAGNGYQQPPTYVSTNAQGPSVSSALSVVIANVTQSITIYTSTGFVPSQSGLEFKVPFQAAASDVITITMSSANASDKTLNGVKSIVSIGQGFQ